ncbi:iron chelate uptake ABC transporter family permease subunit [Salinicoccus sp. ID82-1]|uniref:Iron chelate uptake ABC transporter family permease subunit n=1 Tax=Salinicoccus cyprini TaxID=2493691 RepID=A0A558AR93_9STAP|nr:MULTISPECIES: iron chelate uptake ABC transporter family permease subunit [Salinicoccus]MCG1010189.1 iron chelate uptake ABC transporter family permease subunit [Salinicoccus sp. ID82-1]TVT26756.1 iron chelate uptake ABC transporter family permease subunit [Salinicoccus cyprini]
MLDRKNNRLLIVLSILTLVIGGCYILYQLNFDILFYQLPSRLNRVVTMIIVGTAIAISTVIFQTITRNRILTPSIMGLDSVYLFIQTVIVFIGGAQSILLMNDFVNYIASMLILVLFTVLVFRYLFKFTGSHVFLLLLIGIILGTFFSSLSSFMQMLINPDDFLILQSSMFASFNAINESLIWITGGVVLLMLVIVLKDFHSLDVIALGRDHAVNLGVNYDRKISQLLLIIAVLVSVATALVGPIMFLGLLVVNLAHEMFRTFKHRYLLIGSTLIAVITLLLGQMLTQYVFKQAVEISVIINLAGGIYFIILMLKESRR